jgi:hypothetical protein
LPLREQLYPCMYLTVLISLIFQGGIVSEK